MKTHHHPPTRDALRKRVTRAFTSKNQFAFLNSTKASARNFHSSFDKEIVRYFLVNPLVKNTRLERILAIRRCQTQAASIRFNVDDHRDSISLSPAPLNIPVESFDINRTDCLLQQSESSETNDDEVNWESASLDELDDETATAFDNNFDVSPGNEPTHVYDSPPLPNNESDSEADHQSAHFRQHTILEMAVLLSLLRHRHSLSKSCLTDICRLLRLLRVPNVPVNYRSIFKLIKPRYDTLFLPKLSIVCPTCSHVSTNMTKCLSRKCKSFSGYERAPTVNYTFNIRKQLLNILEREPLMPVRSLSKNVEDIVDSPIYQTIRTAKTKPFVSLLLNSDGVLVQKISRSIWTTSLAINELPRGRRFKLPNMVVAMISFGSQKPKRPEFAKLLDALTDQFVELQQGIDVCLATDDKSCSSKQLVRTSVDVHLIGVVCDKPAQSLVQNMIDCGGYFGCGKCQMQGESVRAGKGHIRCFPCVFEENAKDRSNDSYDQAMDVLSKSRQRRNSLTGARDDETKGHQVDSLHNLYSGAFVCYLALNISECNQFFFYQLKLLKIWLEAPSARKNTTHAMSIFSRRKEVEQTFDSIRFPSTTYRVPGSLADFQKFKANDLRTTLLIGFNAFRCGLSPNQYDNLKALAFATHYAESPFVNDRVVEKMRELFAYFDATFEDLYTKRHVVPVVHSLAHIASTVEQFGPIMNYSTFNFESVMGQLVRTIRDPSKPAAEIVYNLEVLHHSWLASDDARYLDTFKLYIQQINSSKRQARPTSTSLLSNANSIRLYHRINSIPLIDDILNGCHYELYQTAFYKGLRLSSSKLNTNSRTHDGCILFRDAVNPKQLSVGFLRGVAKIKDTPPSKIVFVIDRVVITSNADTFTLNGTVYKCHNVLQGRIAEPCRLTCIDISDIKEKMAFRPRRTNTPDQYYFFRYPNFCEST